MWICSIHFDVMREHRVVMRIYTYLREASAVARSTPRAIPGPPSVGRATSTDSHAFFMQQRRTVSLPANFPYLLMRKLTTVFLALAFALSVPAFGQLTKEQIKERNEISKLSKKDLNSKATKAARKEAKNLKKQGWMVAPGAIPLEKQLDRSYLMQMEYDTDMSPKYIMGEGMSTAENYDAAKFQALELAKQQLASEIQTELAAMIENEVSNRQLGPEQAASITETISKSKSLITQSLGRVLPVVEVYRTLPNRNKEVLVRVAYSMDEARKVTKKAIYEELKAKGQGLEKDLDKAF